MCMLDAYLLGRAEQFCHWWQRRTGFTSMWLALLCLVLFGGILPLLYQAASPMWRATYGSFIFFPVLYVLMALFLYVRVEQYYRGHHERPHPLSLSWRDKPASRYMGCMWMTVILPLPLAAGSRRYLVFVVLAASLSLVLSWYFRAVIPLPLQHEVQEGST